MSDRRAPVSAPTLAAQRRLLSIELERSRAARRQLSIELERGRAVRRQLSIELERGRALVEWSRQLIARTLEARLTFDGMRTALHWCPTTC